MNNTDKSKKYISMSDDSKNRIDFEKHVYDREIDLSNSNDSLVKIFKQISLNSTVLDVGCSNGSLGSILKSEKKCKVTGLDFNEDAVVIAKQRLDEAFTVDVTKDSDLDVIKSRKYDYIIFADILEHLVEPLKILKKFAEFLVDGGEIIISIPNIAHGSIRYMLLQGDFIYTEEGLLDKTHLRFFTIDSVLELLESAKLFPHKIDRTTIDIINYLRSYGFDYNYDQSRVDYLESLPESKTLQFVITCAPINSSSQRKELKNKIDSLQLKVANLNKDDQKWISTSVPEQISAVKQENEALLNKINLNDKKFAANIESIQYDLEVVNKTQNIMMDDIESKLSFIEEFEKNIEERLNHLQLVCSNLEVKSEKLANFLPFKILKFFRRKLLRLG